MNRVYRVSYTFMERNPGRIIPSFFLVEAVDFDQAVVRAKDYLEKCAFGQHRTLESVEVLGEVVSR